MVKPRPTLKKVLADMDQDKQAEEGKAEQIEKAYETMKKEGTSFVLLFINSDANKTGGAIAAVREDDLGPMGANAMELVARIMSRACEGEEDG